MLKKILEIKNEKGLHARPSTKFVEITQDFNGDVFVILDDKKLDAKNVMALMLLGLEKGDKLTLEILGNNENEEKKLFEKLRYLIEEMKFHEN